MKTDVKNHQAGFTLLEFIVALVVAAIVAAMVYTFFGSALTQSSVPIERLQQVSNLSRVMENIVADYERLNQLNLRYKWRSNVKYQVGEIVVPSDGTVTKDSKIANNGRYYVCTTAGTSGGSLPSWPVTTDLTGTVTDGSVAWREKGYVWEPTKTYLGGEIVVPIINNGHFYKCTVAGTSADVEPSSQNTPQNPWPTAPGGEATDGVAGTAVTWKEVGTIIDRSNTSLTDSILIDSIKYYLDNNLERYGINFTVVTTGSNKTGFVKFNGTTMEDADINDEKSMLRVTIKNNETAETLSQIFTIR
jgi:prepilin-type N-terminal cleavage/methylation domain-containing protein